MVEVRLKNRELFNAKATKENSKIAKELVSSELSLDGYSVYTFGSELACLRLYAAYQKSISNNSTYENLNIRDNIDSWVFRLDYKN